MRGCGAACLFVVCSLMALPPVAAQVPNPPPGGAPEVARASAEGSRGTVVVVMESTGGVRAASTLRTALNGQASLRVMSMADVARNKVQPTAILTVSAVAAREISVGYWDLSGGRDALSAPAPARADQLDAVVFALASALLERHRPDLLRDAKRDAAVLGEKDLARTTDALYAVLGRYGRLSPRSNVALRFEDF